jgi:DNA-binding GntR family transcriptional regulator
LKILEGEGQIYSIPHRGYFVAQLSIEELQEIQHIRGLLETDAIRHAVPRLTENDLQNMSTAFDEMAHASAVVDVGAMNAAHTRFHFSILGASGMPKLTRILQQLSEAADPYRAAYHGDETARATAQAEHQRILHAVRAHDIEHIVDLLDEHRRHTLERLGPTLSGTHPPET